MSLIINGTKIKKANYNGTELKKIIFNDVEVFTAGIEITYVANGVTYTENFDEDTITNTTVLNPTSFSTPSKSGCKFSGWCKSTSDTTILKSFRPTEDTTLYAVWVPTTKTTDTRTCPIGNSNGQGGGSASLSITVPSGSMDVSATATVYIGRDGSDDGFSGSVSLQNRPSQTVWTGGVDEGQWRTDAASDSVHYDTFSGTIRASYSASNNGGYGNASARLQVSYLKIHSVG